MVDGVTRTGSVSLVKIARPSVSGVVPRQRLFRMLDSGLKKPVIWVTGPAGAGKTTLVASWIDSRKLPCLWYQVDEGDADIASFFYYMGLAAKKAAPRHKKPLPLLTPEYMMGLPTFTRRYFEELFGRLTPSRSPSFSKRGFGGVIVIDNFQDAPSPAFHDIMGCAMEVIPEGISVIALSRSEPPQELARLRANNGISFMGWNELSFTFQECRDFLEGKALSEESVRQLHKRTDGWAAGLVLITERAKAEEIAYPLISELSNEAVFGYFANEILDKMDLETRDFLLKTSFFPSMTVAAAEALTGNKKSRSILSRLSRSHYFTDWRSLPKPVFQYHPLFREFLQSRARSTFRPEEVAGVQILTASIIEAETRMEEAAALYQEAGAWEHLIRLALSHAQGLVAQGRGQTLDAWIRSIPKAIADNVPWLQYWLGICRLPFDPAGSRKLLDRAFQLFDARKDDTGMLLSWSATVTSLLHEWDQFRKMDTLIEWLQKRMKKNKTFPSPQIEAVVSVSMATALMWRRGSPSDLREWHERAMRLTLTAGDINLRLQACHGAIQFYFLSGDFAGARIVSDELASTWKSAGVSPMMKALCNGMEPSIDILTMDFIGSSRSISEYLQTSDEIGIHIWDHMLYAQGVCYSLNTRDIKAGGDFLEKMKESLAGPKCFGLFHYHILAAWYYLLRDETTAALSHAEEGLKFIEMSGAFLPEAEFQPHFVIAQIANEQKDYQKADNQLSVAQGLAEKTESGILRYMILMTEAQFSFDRGKQKEGVSHLRKAMELGRQRGYISMFWWWQPEVMARLCRRALEEGIEEEYVRHLIIKRRLIPDPTSSGTEKWPYPVKIYTLGSFRILLNDEPLEFSGKIQKKPLELLKAIIAYGGRDVPQEKLLDALWPDADGDSAAKSLEVNLYRLRNLSGTDGFIRVQGRRFSIDTGSCWIDAQILEHIHETEIKNRVSSESGNIPSLTPAEMRYCERAVDLYKGSFLENDSDKSWTLHMRERMRTKVLAIISALASSAETAGDYERAVHFWRRGIEIDNLSEKSYQHIMLCYDRLGQKTEIVRAYRQCCEALSRGLDIQPSVQTAALFERFTGRS
ncbi:MAG: hypothetical protein C0402_08490 [Thermodesulfovibrio sp.]|nr:hypothetical protein [Thermodesulfovibrio sp.]